MLDSSCAAAHVIMAHSVYEYVRAFEEDDRIIPHVFIGLRIDGKGFHKYVVQCVLCFCGSCIVSSAYV